MAIHLTERVRFGRFELNLRIGELVVNEPQVDGDAMNILSRVTGRNFTYFQVPLDVVRQRMGEDAVKMYEWFDRVGFAVDRAALHREFPDVTFQDFESWAKKQDWSALHA